MMSERDVTDQKKIAFFDCKGYIKYAFEKLLEKEPNLRFTWIDSKLSINTVGLAFGHEAVCVFVNDTVSEEVLGKLKENNINLVALRCAGFNNVDLNACK